MRHYFFFCSFLMGSKKSIAKMNIGFHEAGSGFCGGFGLFVLKEAAAQAV